ncbi:hypothetical protein AVEN_135396-1 [Araneus ventricosus]|uniref:HAT C-terminal dimerisation domain-containing protein n=1 Tax=Araneus ventricosus TaxID=182803 RepID=A0A4Y2KZF5_ARAVE|nr:hypothetical protein AVEN_135396-1 [Araneus ventricosus]
MAKNKGPHSSRPRKNPRYNHAAKTQDLRREKEKRRRSNEKADSDAAFLDQEPIERRFPLTRYNEKTDAEAIFLDQESIQRTHSKAVEDQKEFSETFVSDQISQHFKISSDLPNLCTEVSKELKDNIPPNELFLCNMTHAYIGCAKWLVEKMPFANPFLKAVSSLDPCNRKTSVALEWMKELLLYASNVVQVSEKAYDLEIHNFQNDHFTDIVEESIDLWWRDVENTSKYPLLSRMTFALLTCFHEPKVESSFRIMNNVITPGSNRLNVSTFNAMQCINNILCRVKATVSSDTEKKPLNRLAVLGALATGSGFSQEEEKFSVMNVQYMSKEKFACSEKIASVIVDNCAQEKMLEAINEKKRLAQIRGDVDAD